MDEERIFCLSCGRSMPKDALFCPLCGATVASRETKATDRQAAERLCLVCGRSYPTQYGFCPHCGSYSTGQPQQYSYQKAPLGSIKYVAYIAAFLIPIAGVIWGIIWMVDKDEEKKGAGKITLIIAILSWLLNCFLLYFVLGGLY